MLELKFNNGEHTLSMEGDMCIILSELLTASNLIYNAIRHNSSEEAGAEFQRLFLDCVNNTGEGESPMWKKISRDALNSKSKMSGVIETYNPFKTEEAAPRAEEE